MPYTTLSDFIARTEAHLSPLTGPETLPETGDHAFLDESAKTALRMAGVVVAIRNLGTAPSVLFTERPATMAVHPGQVAFPGGKVDPKDAGPVAAAIRETHEEVGASRKDLTLLARSAPYVTGTGFRITPVIGLLPEDFMPIPEEREVVEIFETPLSFLMDPQNHIRKTAYYKGMERDYIEIKWQKHRIWGVTAGIIRGLYERLYEEPQE